MTMARALREEFRCANFGLNYEDASRFATSRWQESTKVSGWFVFYRLLLAAITFGVLIGTLVESQFENTVGYWFIYLTDLGYLGLTIHMALSAAVVIEYLLNQRDDFAKSKMTILTKLSWITYNAISMSAIVITAVYWIALYEPGMVPGASNVMVHAFNTVLIVLDVFVAARPYRLLHIYQSIIPLFLYVIFSVIYWAAGGVAADGSTCIYPILDWDSLESTLAIIGILLALLFPLHAILWFLHLLRDFLYRAAFNVKVSAPTRSYVNDAFESNGDNNFEIAMESRTDF